MALVAYLLTGNLLTAYHHLKLRRHRPQITQKYCWQHPAAALRRITLQRPPAVPAPGFKAQRATNMQQHCPAAPCSGTIPQSGPSHKAGSSTSTQAPKCTQRTLQRPSSPSSPKRAPKRSTPKRTQQRHPAAAPARKLPSAQSSGTLQQHQHPSSQAHTAAAPCSGTSAKARKRTHVFVLEHQRPCSGTSPGPKTHTYT